MAKFITYTNNGVNYVVRFSKNEGKKRTDKIIFKRNNEEIGRFTLTQQSKKYFKWSRTNKSNITLYDVEYSKGVFTENIDTNYDNLTVVCDSSWAKGSINGKVFTYEFDENTNTTDRNCTFYIKNGNEQLGIATLKQKGCDYSKYLWINNQGNISTNVIASSDSAVYSVQLLTNYDINELTINGCKDIVESTIITNTKKLNITLKPNTDILQRTCTIIVSSEDKQVQVNVQQNGKELVFKFNDTNSNITNVRFSSSEGCFERFFETNYTNLTATTESDIITQGTIEISNGKIIGNNNANETTEGKVGVVYMMSDNKIIGTINLTQLPHGAYYFMFENDSTALTVNTLAIDTSITVGIETNYELSEINTEIVTGNTLDLIPSYTDVNVFNGNFTMNNTDDVRTVTINFKLKSTNELLGVLIVNQFANENKYFKWIKSNDKILEVLSESNQTSFIEEFETTYDNISFELDNTYDWIINVEPEGNNLSVYFTNNETTENRTAKIIVKSNGQEIQDCYLKLTQEKIGEFYFIIDE